MISQIHRMGLIDVLWSGNSVVHAVGLPDFGGDIFLKITCLTTAGAEDLLKMCMCNQLG